MGAVKMLNLFPKNLPSNLNFQKVKHQKNIRLYGDSVTFSRLLENNRSNDQANNQWPLASTVSDYKLGICDTLALTLSQPNQTNN